MPPLTEWTQEDERQLREAWQKDPLRDAMLKSSNDKPALWKNCARFMRCLPTSIIGLKTSLGVDVSSNQVLVELSDLPRAPHWPERLCQSLTKLIPHPMFQGNPQHLTTAIQYAVICCTDDRRPWPLINYSDEGFLGMFHQVIEWDQNRDIPIAQLHKSA